MNAYPFLVTIRLRSEYLCSGSIINPLHIVSTASCVTSNKNIIYGNLQILSATDKQNYQQDHGNINDVSIVVIHPDYSPNNFWANDIGILKLTKSLPSNQVDGYITLPVSSTVYNTFSHLVLIGWEKFDESDSLQLSKLDVQLMLLKPCRKYFEQYGNLNNAQRCITSPLKTHRNIDYGDSGSPVVTSQQQNILGMVSLISPNPDHPVIITQILRHYTGWIINMLEKY
ncbi:trypsin-like [Aphidius gifuensis]|nr:trypsin-like [Aphidius gifuensis]